MIRTRPVRQPRLLLALTCAVLTAGACRQTVMFDDGRDGGGGGGEGGGGSTFCPGGQTRRLEFALRSADVIPALDRGLAMQRGMLGNATRLNAARAALSALVAKYGAAVRFGFVEFPGAGFACGLDPMCCPSDALPPSHGTQAFEAALHACDDPAACPSSSDRPAAPALFECGRVFASRPEYARHVLLLTDGQPGCALGESSGCRQLQEYASLFFSELRVRTHVVGIELSSIGCLDTVASWGNGELYLVNSANELNEDLDDIIRPIAREACHADVLSPPAGRERAALLRDGVEIPRNRNDGWDFDSNSATSLTLYGDACDEVLARGAENLDLRACDPQ